MVKSGILKSSVLSVENKINGSFLMDGPKTSLVDRLSILLATFLIVIFKLASPQATQLKLLLMKKQQKC